MTRGWLGLAAGLAFATTGATPFRWLNVSKSWAQWQAVGQDAAGTFGP